MFIDNDKWLVIWSKIRKYCNKYVIAFVLFAIVMLFLGDHTLPARLENERKIAQLKANLRECKARTAQKEQRIQVMLTNPDSVERYAREHYYMKESNEDIFLIDEED